MKPRVPKSGEAPRKRRPRLAQTETRARMLRVAAGSLTTSGLTAGLDHVSFEDVIREADVSRTAAYRCWPHKDEFLADLAIELAGQAIPAAGTRDVQSTTWLRDLIVEDVDRLRTPDGRAELLERVVGSTAGLDFDLDRSEVSRWRTYLALVMAAHQLPAGELGDRVRSAVVDADRRLVDRLAANYRRILEWFGYQPRVDYPTLARIAVALMRGLVIGEMASPDERRSDQGPSLAAAAFAGLVTAHTEVADGSDWDDARIAERVGQLDVASFFDTPDDR